MVRTRKQQFRVYVELGNDAMQTGRDVSNILRDLAYELEDSDELPAGKNLLDDNGNVVGRAFLTV